METKLSPSMAPSDIHIHHSSRDEIIHPSPNFSPSLWADLSLMVPDDQIIRKCSEEHYELKKEMRSKLTNESTAMEEKLTFIDILERLGISYLFKNDIEEELKKIYLSSFPIEAKDLSTVSLYFRLLRQYGFYVSAEIFNVFKDKDGFKNLHANDIKGLLNLYEVAHTRIHGEDILEEALKFSSTHLKLMTSHLPPLLSKLCVHTLELPLQKCLARVEARFFISLYEEDDESVNDSVLRLAKLDYALLQNLHRKELAEIARWWKDFNLLPKYPYARDRLVELYFWNLGIYFEPEYSLDRVLLTKIVCIIMVLDDTYDSYGTLDELKIFTEAVERWDISEIDRLPEYMKDLYKALLQLYASVDEELQTLGRSYAVSYSKESMIKQIQCYYIETRFFKGHTLSFEEYLKNALITCGDTMLSITSILRMDAATMDVLELLKSNPKILVASSTICRLTNDMASYEVAIAMECIKGKGEKKSGPIITGIDCYMKQYGVTKEETFVELDKMVENAWKDMNEGCRMLKGAPHDVILNFARVSELFFKHNINGLNDPEKGLVSHITDMFVNSIEI